MGDPMGPRPASVSGEYESKNERHASTNSEGSMSAPGAKHGPPMALGRDPILPAVLEFWVERTCRIVIRNFVIRFSIDSKLFDQHVFKSF